MKFSSSHSNLNIFSFEPKRDKSSFVSVDVCQSNGRKLFETTNAILQ